MGLKSEMVEKHVIYPGFCLKFTQVREDSQGLGEPGRLHQMEAQMSWYTNSYAWIKQQQAEHPDLDHTAMRKHCSKNYPFAERRGAAYKGFLAAMRDVFGAARKPANSNQVDAFSR